MSSIAPAAPRPRRPRYTSRIANTIYSAVLLAMLYDWPYQIYQRLGPRMSETTARERFIVQEVGAYADRLQLRLKPTFVVGSVPASAGAFSGNAVIVIPPEMLDASKWSDNEVRFILAHEVGHIARLDAYRFWTRWTERGAEGRESDADHIAVGLVGCRAMEETVARYWGEFMKGYQEKGDHHPHPSQRLQHACPGHGLAAQALSARLPNALGQRQVPSSGFRSVTGLNPSAPAPTAHGTVRTVHVTAIKETDDAPSLPALTIAGLGPDNVFMGESLTFKLEGVGPLDLAKDSDGLILGPKRERLALKAYWVFHPADNSFTISDGKLQQLMDALPAGTLDISVNFVSADGEFAAVYQFEGSQRTKDVPATAVRRQ